MRPLLALLTGALLGVGVCACGSGGGASPAIHAAATQPSAKPDRDNDGDNNDDDGNVLSFGHAAVGSERQALITLVKRYYAAAVAEDGAAVCSLLAPFIAESVAEKIGHSPALRGTTCAVVMSKLLKLQHRALVGKSATLKQASVRILGNRALTAVSFSAPIVEVRQLAERRIAGGWRLLFLLDGIIE